MITIYLQGGLGNQLFQIFTLISCSLNFQIPFIFINQKQLGTGENGATIRYTYWTDFLDNLKPFIKEININLNNFIIFRESQFNYDYLLNSFMLSNTNNNENILLIGYFQSYLYFNKHKNQIINILKLNNKRNELIKKIILNSNTFYNLPNNEINNLNIVNIQNSISLHFRLGDYKKYPTKHPVLPKEYYSNALEFILNKIQNDNINNNLFSKKVYYFCETNEEDLIIVNETINYLQNNYPLLIFEKVSNNLKDWEQMLFMSFMKYNIIANSTFSWWGSYLNQNKNKIITYPSLWFGSELNNDTSDLLPNDWNIINF